MTSVMIYKKTILLALSFVSMALSAQKTIDQIATYDDQAQVFVLSETYEVKAGDILVIPAGTRLHFGPLVGINVKGELFVNGQADRPVIMMSRRSALGSGSPHDWAGIRVFQGGSVKIEYGVITNASFAVRTCCDNVTMLNTVFHTNGVNFQVADRRISVFDREPVNYERVPTKINIETNHLGVDYDAIVGKKYVPWQTWVYSPVAVGLMVVGPIYLGRWNKSAREYRDFDPRDHGMSFSEGERRLADLKRESNINAGLGIGLTAAGIALGTYTVIFTIRF